MNTKTTYIVIVRVTVDESADDHLRSIQAITDEVRSWLESLNSHVEQVTVSEEQSHGDDDND